MPLGVRLLLLLAYISTHRKSRRRDPSDGDGWEMGCAAAEGEGKEKKGTSQHFLVEPDVHFLRAFQLRPSEPVVIVLKEPV